MINPDLILALLILYTIASILIVGDGFNFLHRKVRDSLNFMRSKVEVFKAKKTTPNVLSLANNNEYVDLGLSVKWATCNVGANTPSDFGDYFNFDEAIKINGLPTKEQWEELRTKCKFKYNKKTDLIVVTGPNGNTICFPIACEKYGQYDKKEPGAYFWVSRIGTGIFDNFAEFYFFIKRRTNKVDGDFNLLDRQKYFISVRTVL